MAMWSVDTILVLKRLRYMYWDESIPGIGTRSRAFHQCTVHQTGSVLEELNIAAQRDRNEKKTRIKGLHVPGDEYILMRNQTDLSTFLISQANVN